MSKKGQAAMEFLMTYGWAILAAIIAIGVLAYFGVFSPGKYVTGSAIVNPPFYVNAHNVKASAGVTIELKNNGGEDYDIQNVVVSGCVGAITPALPKQILAGGIQAVTIACSPTEGDTFKGDVTVTYTKTGSTTDLTSTGTIAEKVTA